jgi:3-mercaptopyruvate sulfurtransferase SseA
VLVGRAGHIAVRDAIADPGTTILDVRSEAEYRGERFWPPGGMEPGGLWVASARNGRWLGYGAGWPFCLTRTG